MLLFIWGAVQLAAVTMNVWTQKLANRVHGTSPSHIAQDAKKTVTAFVMFQFARLLFSVYSLLTNVLSHCMC